MINDDTVITKTDYDTQYADDQSAPECTAIPAVEAVDQTRTLAGDKMLCGKTGGDPFISV